MAGGATWAPGAGLVWPQRQGPGPGTSGQGPRGAQWTGPQGGPVDRAPGGTSGQGHRGDQWIGPRAQWAACRQPPGPKGPIGLSPLVPPWALSTGPPWGPVHWFPLEPCPLVPGPAFVAIPIPSQGHKGPKWRLQPYQSCSKRALGPKWRLRPYQSHPRGPSGASSHTTIPLQKVPGPWVFYRPKFSILF